MKSLAVSLLASAVVAALATAGAPAVAQTSPYDAPTDPSYPAAPGVSPPSSYAPVPGSSGTQPGSAYAPPPPDVSVPISGSPSGRYGTVISATPITSLITTRQQRCYDQPGVVRAQPSGLGAVVGAVVGGLVGNTIGAGVGRGLATGAGVIGGAIAGGSIEAANAPTIPVTTTQCDYPATTQARVVGYDVVYDFNGQRYTTRTMQDPGSRIALDVRPAGATPDEILRAAASVPPPSAYPAYPYPYPYPYPTYAYPAPVYVGPPVSIGFGFRGRWR